MLGAPEVPGDDVARLAVDENCAAIVRHIASYGNGFERENPFWASLLDLLPDVKPDADRLLHPTRCVEMPGIDRGKVGRFRRWIRPRGRVPA